MCQDEQQTGKGQFVGVYLVLVLTVNVILMGRSNRFPLTLQVNIKNIQMLFVISYLLHRFIWHKNIYHKTTKSAIKVALHSTSCHYFVAGETLAIILKF